MDREQLEAIATRKTTCHPFGETVSLSRAERDQLVGICRLVVEKFTSGNEIPVERITVRADEVSQCSCATCRPHSVEMRMILCSTCGNKRCPHATDHRNACTGSNDPGQPGSSY